MRSTVRCVFAVGLVVSLAVSGCSGKSENGGPGPTCDMDNVEEHHGDGTYYDADGSGNCSFPASPGDLMVAAMNDADYAGSAACGACIEAQGPEGTATVRIVDRCPECPQGDVDFSYEAFGHVAQHVQGRVDITWHYVECDVTGPIRYHFKEGSNPWWMAVQIRNHRHPIAGVEYLGEDGNFHQMVRASYNFFLEEAGLGSGPYTFRVTDVNGQQLTDQDVVFVEGGEVDGAAQFPPCP